MGMALLELFPVVLQTIKRLDRHLSTLAAPPSWNIETIMTQPASESMIYDAEYSQPLCTAVQIALVDLLTHWGVRPSATIGHSSGEHLDTNYITRRIMVLNTNHQQVKLAQL